MCDSTLYFIAVGTPPDEDGSADLKHVLSVADEIGQHMRKYCVVVNKSTVPVGTADRVRNVIRQRLAERGLSLVFDVVSNPEFLKEGDAINDFMHPDRVIVGSDSNKASEILRQLYAPFTRNHERTQIIGIRDAEMTKYAANAMLATKISFINEIALLCDHLGVDVEKVRQGIGSDSRIGYSFIYPGCGYGGSCFPKDVNALIRTAEENGLDVRLLRSVKERNCLQKQRLAEKIMDYFGTNLNGIVFGLWGLSFKPGTDDMREAPSVELLTDLISHGARIRAYDPVAMNEARRHLPKSWFTSDKLELCQHQYDALHKVDALVLVTEWMPFRNPDFNAMQRLMKSPVIFDGRNQYDMEQLHAAGFEYFGIGRRLESSQINFVANPRAVG